MLIYQFLTIIFLLFCSNFISPMGFCSAHRPTPVNAVKPLSTSGDYQEYIKFFEEVFKTVEDNYFQKPDRAQLNDFIRKFNQKIYPQLKSEGKSSDYVRWRSAWYLVDSLKFKQDKFSQFYPPKPAEKFKQEALGQRIDVGIEGKKVDAGFLITRMEPHSDAYAQGLREDDILFKIDGADLKPLLQADIEKKLTPLAGTKLTIDYISHEDHSAKQVKVTSQEYFKQTVFLHPIEVPGIFCLEIPKFNRLTGEELLRFLLIIEAQNPKGLVLDLRGNPGGPPLAAREISAFFLKGGDDFAYFQKRGQEKAGLDVPVIQDQYKFNAPIVILVDQDSGSASELFTGVMQFRHRAVVMGTNTAGQVMLKSMFPLSDGSMIGLVTGLGHLPDGTAFSFDGVSPDQVITNAPKDGLINLAAAYILMKLQGK